MPHQSHKMLEGGARAPEFELKSTAGEVVRSGDLLQKGPALVFFFKVSCPVCQFTAPFIERLAAGNKVQVIGISQDDASSTNAFNKRFGVSFPVLLDETRAHYPASNGFGISSVPSLFLVEADGTVASAFSGFSKSDLETLALRMEQTVFQPGEKVPAFRSG